MIQPLQYSHHNRAWSLEASEATWDTKIYGFPVVSVSKFTIEANKTADYSCETAHFQAWLQEHGIGLVSVRLGHECLRESMVLESMGFRFIEMVLHPTINLLQSTYYPDDTLSISFAQAEDLPSIQGIAQSAFGYERLHVDPRIDASKGNIRYGNWVLSALNHPRQRLLKITDGNRLLAFFVIEVDGKNVYWHLTAVSPDLHGQGYGYRVWLAMLKFHRLLGCNYVSTTISARNTPVLNLYSKLNFKMAPPEMTFHWVGDVL